MLLTDTAERLFDFRDQHMVWLTPHRATIAFFSGIAGMAVGAQGLAVILGHEINVAGALTALLSVLSLLVGTGAALSSFWGLMSLNRARAIQKARAAHPAGRGMPTTLPR